jgi:hypothetical protein
LTAVLGHQPFDPWPVDPGLVPTDRQWHYQRDETFAGSAELISELLYCNRKLDDVTVPPSRNQLWKDGRFH